MDTNHPEKPHFDRIFSLAKQNAENAEDIKELYKSAKDAGVDTKMLRRSVALALEDEEKRRDRRQLEESAEALLVRIGHLAGTPLGDAAQRAAQ